MPPQSRRQRKHATEVSRIQMRNRIAAGLGVVALGVSIWLIYFLFPGSSSQVVVSVFFDEQMGAREIPFAKESSNVVRDAFANTLLNQKGEYEVRSIGQTESLVFEGQRNGAAGGIESSDTFIPEQDERDTYIAYFNGHLVDGASRPSARNNTSDKTSDPDSSSSPDPPAVVDSNDVFLIMPEGGNRELNLDQILQRIDQAKAKVKIVIFDAGRYSWSPAFPGRQANHFQSALARKLKENPLQLGDNFWVILSHSDLQVSNVSTALESSLFSYAIAQSLEAIQKKGDLNLDVLRWFADIRQRTVSYSRNMSGVPLQHPVLLRANQGEVSVPFDPAELEPDDQYRLGFAWKSVTAQETDSDQDSKNEDQVSARWSDYARNVDDVTRELLNPENINALPYDTSLRLEHFLEFGRDGAGEEGADMTTRRSRYRSILDKARDPEDKRQLIFQPEQLDRKLAAVTEFRRHIFDYQIWLRFRNQMRLFGGDVKKLPSIPDPLKVPASLSDRQLETSEDTSPTWNLEAFTEKNYRQFIEVFDAVEAGKPLTPMQAEMVGVVTQRYLPLLAGSMSEDARAKVMELAKGEKAALPDSFKIDLAPGKNLDAFDSTWFDKAIADSASDMKGLVSEAPSSFSAMQDTQRRYYLAARGTDFAAALDAQVPNIQWRPITYQVDFTSDYDGNQFVVPMTFTGRVRLKMRTLGTDAVELKLVAVDPEQQALDFGFNESFVKRKPFEALQQAGDRYRYEGEVDLFFRNRGGSTQGGSPIQFVLESRRMANVDGAVTSRYPFSVKIEKNAGPFLRIRRRVGEAANDAPRQYLTHWNEAAGNARGSVPPLDQTYRPLILPTLPNVRSVFDLSLGNNSGARRSYTAKLYRLKSTLETDSLPRADAVNGPALNAFIKRMTKAVESEGDQYFARRSFELIAEGVVATRGDERLTKLSLTTPKPPAKANGEAPPAAAGDGEPPVVDCDLPLLLLLYNDDPNRDPNQPLVPNWFQFVGFQVDDALDLDFGSLAQQPVSQTIRRVFRDDVENLGSLADPSIVDQAGKQIAAGQLITLTNSGVQDNQLSLHPLSLKQMLGGQSFSFGLDEGEEDALYMIDLFGVPNYRVYRKNFSSLANDSMMTGVRVRNLPDGWQCNPASWSFTDASQTDSQHRWLTPSGKQQMVFLRGPAGNRNPTASLDLFLPRFGEDVLGNKPRKFWYRWRTALGSSNGQQASNQMPFVNRREHRVSIGEQGLAAWTKVSALTIQNPNFVNQELAIFYEDDSQQPVELGSWKFVMSSLNQKPEFGNTPKKVSLKASEFIDLKFDVDFKKIRPRVRPEDVAFQWGTGERFEAVELLKSAKQIGDEKYEIELHRLLAASGQKLADLIDDKKWPGGQRILVKVYAKDFFGEETNDEFEFQTVPPPKIVVQPPPKTGSVTVALFEPAVGTPETPAVVKGLGNPAIRINGLAFELGKNPKRKLHRDLDKLTIQVSLANGKIKVDGLVQGRKYTIEVNAIVGTTQEVRASGVGEVAIAKPEQEMNIVVK